MKRVLLTLLYCLSSVVLAADSGAELTVQEPAGYRTELYDDVVPQTLTGATRVTALDVQKLQLEVDAVVIDVIPEHRRPDVLPEGQLWIPLKHKGVPGAVWLPDVGFGVLSDVTDQYFQHHLALATAGNLKHPLVFYCRADCWMSWNAAKRALAYGYQNIYWFADGIDDWSFEGFDVEILKPAAGQRQAVVNK